MIEFINREPMTIGKILDKSFQFIFKNIVWIALVGVIVTLPETIIAIILYLNQPLDDTDTTQTYVLSTITGMPWLAASSVMLMISIFIWPILSGTVTLLVGQQFCGKKMTFSEGFKNSVKKWIPLILLQLLIWLAIGLGMVLFIIPGLIALCAAACAVPAMMFEDLGPKEAFGRSWNLTKGSRLRIFGYFLLVGIIIKSALTLPSMIMEFLPIDPIYRIGLSSLISTPFHVLWQAVTALLFFDLCMRKEAMDLEVQANTISVSPEKME